MNHEKLKDCKVQLEDLFAKGDIKPTKSPYGATLLFVHKKCRNPSFGLVTKAKGVARVRAKGNPGSHIKDSRECRKV
jgi:hypothetical protein